jgi:hypothetical protein
MQNRAAVDASTRYRGKVVPVDGRNSGKFEAQLEPLRNGVGIAE